MLQQRQKDYMVNIRKKKVQKIFTEKRLKVIEKYNKNIHHD